MDKKEKLYELKNYNKRLLIKDISTYITQYIELINEFIFTCYRNNTSPKL